MTDVGPLLFSCAVSLFILHLIQRRHVCFSTPCKNRMSVQEGAVSLPAVSRSSLKCSFSSGPSGLSAAGIRGTMYGPARPMAIPTSPKIILAFRDKRL